MQVDMAKTTEIICCRTTIKILRVMGLFPPNGREQNPGSTFIIKWATLMILSSLTFIGSCLHFIMSMKDNVHYHLDIDMAIMLSMFATYMFTCFFFFKTKTAYQLYNNLSDFEEYEKPHDFDKNNEFFGRLSFYHYVYMECLVSALLLFSNVIKTGQCRRENLEYGLHEVCGLFSYTWMPFDIDYFPAKEIYLFLQLFGTHYLYMIAGTMAWAAVEAIQHIIVRIRHSKHLFLEAIKERNIKKQRELFNTAVRYHDRVLGLEHLLNRTFGMFMFCHLAITAPILGTAFFAILHGGSGSSLFICLGWFLGITMDCISGQRIQNESIGVGLAIYNSDWYSCSEDIKRDIWFVLMRCTRPMCLRAISFGILDHVMLLGVLKASYSYIALFTQTM